MSLPSHIIIEIPLTPPAKSLVECKSVCKQWLDLTSDPCFAKLHSTRSKLGVAIHQSEPSNNLLRVADFDDFHDPTAEIDLKSLSPSPEDTAIIVDGSVKGLLLHHDTNYKHEALYVCNPLTHEYIELVSPKQVVRYPSVVTHRFGVTKRSEEFKVVRNHQEREMDLRSGSYLRIPNSECQVYTLGTREWRGVGEAPLAYYGRLIGQFFRGIFTGWLRI